MFDPAPPPEPPAETIIVTARALGDPESERAYSVDRIGQAALTNSPRTQLDEILKQVPGLQLFRRSDSRSGHPTSQGVTLRALGGNASSRALLVLDGVPQADPFGGWINWPAYDPAALADIRIIRGGGGAAYGPGALAGVIDMTSNLEAGVRAGLDAGSRRSFDGRIQMVDGLAEGAISIAARGARGDGFVPITADTRGPVDRPAPYEEASLRTHWVGPVAEDIDLQLTASGFTDRRDRGLPFTGNRTDGTDASLRIVGRGGWQFSALGYAQWRKFRSSFASVTPDRTEASRVSLQDSVPSSAVGGSMEVRPPLSGQLEIRIGADARLADGESRELFAYVDDEPTRRRVAGGNSSTVGIFGEATATLGSITVTGSGRLDRWKIANGELREWVIATGGPLRDDQFADRSGWRPTARAGAYWEPGPRWSLRSAAYLGWRPPTLNELFRPFRAGQDATAANPELNPEKLRGAELGATYRRSSVSLSLTAFANRLEDAIANVTLGQGPGVFPGVGFVSGGGEYRQRLNVEAITVRGVEGSAELARGAWMARAGMSLVDATVRDNGIARQLDGLRPAQTPKASLTGAIGWSSAGRELLLSVRHTGPQFEDDLNDEKLPAATVIDAFAAWPLSRTLQLLLRGENLLDERVVAGIDGDGAIERATPRTFWLGLRLDQPRK